MSVEYLQDWYRSCKNAPQGLDGLGQLAGVTASSHRFKLFSALNLPNRNRSECSSSSAAETTQAKAPGVASQGCWPARRRAAAQVCSGKSHGGGGRGFRDPRDAGGGFRV